MRSAKDRIMEERKIDRRREREEEDGERGGRWRERERERELERQVKSCCKKNDYIRLSYHVLKIS